MDVSKLKISKKNPRQIKGDQFERLKQSIREFPEMMRLRPIVYDPATMEVLGGNMRLRAIRELNMKDIPDEWFVSADELTDEQKREFVIKDNVGFGEWDWDVLANEWDDLPLEDWGLDTPGFDMNTDGLGEGFTLPDGDKAPFQQMTFTLADEQAVQIENAIADIKETEEYKYAETMGNENSNGNALYLIVMQWAEQRK